MGELVQFPANDLRHNSFRVLSELASFPDTVPVPPLDPVGYQRQLTAELNVICRQSAQLHRQTCQVLERALSLADLVHQESPSVCAVTSNRDGGPHVCLHETERF